MHQHQLQLALEYAPRDLVRHGLREAHSYPLVGRRTRRDGFWSGRVPADRAWVYPYIEIARSAEAYAAVVLDIDAGLTDALMLDLPTPNWVVRHGKRDSGHAVWCLETPVHRRPESRSRPLGYFRAINDYYVDVTGADQSFAGVLSDNPVLPDRGRETEWKWRAPYSLDALAEAMPARSRQRPKLLQTGVGRNVDLFAAGMKWAGSSRNAALPVLAELEQVNGEFDFPLPLSEIEATAKSIEGYRERWAARGWDNPRWRARQAARGRKGGRPRLYVPGHEPWKLEGISRRAWFYRQARERCTKANTDDIPKTNTNSPAIGGVQTRAAEKLRGFRSGWNDGRHGGGRERPLNNTTRGSIHGFRNSPATRFR